MNEYIEDNIVNLNFYGIEMRGLNDEHKFTRFANNHELNEVITKSGIPVRVYVQRGNKSTALVTFHDIGTNHSSFSSFLNYPEMSVILDNFTVYNICAPGHFAQDSKYVANSSSTEEKFSLLSKNKAAEDSEGEIFSITGDQKQPLFLTRPYPTMDELTELIDSVTEHFQLKCFLGMGVGAGANVLARYGIRYPTKLLGLFLINPDDSTSGYYHWTKARWSDLPYLKTGLITDWMDNYLLDRWFGSAAERNGEVEEYYLQVLREMNHMAVAGYIESYMNRSALGMVRPLSDLDKLSRTINADSFLITGEFATDLVKTMVDMNGNMNPSRTQFLAIPDSSGMVLEEAPGKVANIFLNFLRNLGIMITMTPEKLQKAALERQLINAKSLSENDTVRQTYEFSNRG